MSEMCDQLIISYDAEFIQSRRCTCVGEVRSDGRGTDGLDADGFILVLTKKARKAKIRKPLTHCAATRGQGCFNQLNVVSRSLSRNNPVSINEV